MRTLEYIEQILFPEFFHISKRRLFPHGKNVKIKPILPDIIIIFCLFVCRPLVSSPRTPLQGFALHCIRVREYMRTQYRREWGRNSKTRERRNGFSTAGGGREGTAYTSHYWNAVPLAVPLVCSYVVLSRTSVCVALHCVIYILLWPEARMYVHYVQEVRIHKRVIVVYGSTTEGYRVTDGKIIIIINHQTIIIIHDYQ